MSSSRVGRAEPSSRVGSSSIVKVELYVTTYCKGGCPFCFGQGDFSVGGQHVPVDRLLHRASLLSEYHKKHPLNVVALLGGEPLSHPDLPILAERFGDGLPFALVSAGLPDAGADLDALVPRIKMWGATYNPHLAERFVALVNRLLDRGRSVNASMHFHDFESFRCVNLDFLERGLPRLELPASWGESFRRYLESWRPETYYEASFQPFRAPLSPQMSMCYSIIDQRFTRRAPRQPDCPIDPNDRSYPCHLFCDPKAVSIAEDGRLLPCTSNAQRHAAPVIRDLDRYAAGLPDDLGALLDRLAERLLGVTQERICRVGCRNIDWALDR